MNNRSQEMIRKAYDAFNSRRVEEVLSLMHPNVHWPNGWEGGYVEGQDAVSEYWTRQWNEINPQVSPLSIIEKWRALCCKRAPSGKRQKWNAPDGWHGTAYLHDRKRVITKMESNSLDRKTFSKAHTS
jgi:nuclear transport factor 2 (NTF2) superfamily protein